MMADPAQTLIVRVFQWLLGFRVFEPKSKTGPKFDLDLEEPGNKIGPREWFSDGIRTGPTGQNCKVLQNKPKKSFGPRKLKTLRIGPELQRWISFGDLCN